MRRRNSQSKAAAEAPANDAEIVVTAVARSANRLDSSVSVSSLGAEAIGTGRAAEVAAAELFRSLPGIRWESSGGEGNANIQVRGIPISTGGAKLLQLQEDGLPVLRIWRYRLRQRRHFPARRFRYRPC